jgi:hypothetical protein
LARLAGWCFGHRRTVLAAWLIVAAAVIGIAAPSLTVVAGIGGAERPDPHPTSLSRCAYLNSAL